MLEAAELIPFTTPSEFGIILRCAAIYLLGFLNPNSTGCEFATLRSSASATLEDCFDMELEERLENTSRFFQAYEFGQVNVCSDEYRERAFKSFLLNGLRPLLSRQAAHPHQTDLLHLFALTISPQLNVDAIDNIVAPFEDSKVPAWLKTKRLMRGLHAQSFALDYMGRLVIIELVAKTLVIPPTDSPPMLAGAVPHLLAALLTFAAHSARSAADAHSAHTGMVRIATQIRQEWIVREVFYMILAQTLEDRNRCKCPSFCSSKARAQLLGDCILLFNDSRHNANQIFIERAFVALHASIEEEIEPWKTGHDNEPQGACLLSSLLHASESLFYFVERESKIEIDGFLEISIQLLHHPHLKVRNSASSLLGIAFGYLPTADIEKFMPSVKESLMVALDPKVKHFSDPTAERSCLDVVSVSARISSAFASDLLSHLLTERIHNRTCEEADFDIFIAECVSRCIASIACANPLIAMRNAQRLQDLFHYESSKVAKGHLLAALLSTRQALPIGGELSAKNDIVEEYLSNRNIDWSSMKLARHALVTGNFSVAKLMFDQILLQNLSERSFLWISALSKVADAESHLIHNGAKGITMASNLIEIAVSYLESLHSLGDDAVGFQILFLRLRLDFLDISASMRLLCREIRLSGSFPKETTRGGLHINNIFKLWIALAGRYMSLYRQFGLVMCRQSRSAIRTMYAICRQIGSARFLIRGDIGNRANVDRHADAPKGDCMHPTIRFLEKVSNKILSKIDKYVEPPVRVTVLVEVLEGVLKFPTPFPRCFIHPKNVPMATLRVSLDPAQNLLPMGQEEVNIDGLPTIVDSNTIYPGTNLNLVASGSVPVKLFNRRNRFLQLLLSTRIRFVSSLQDLLVSEAEKPEIAIKIQHSGPLEIQQLSVSSSFVVPFELPKIKSEGVYLVDCFLGCREVGGGTWELRHDHSNGAILIRVTRRLHDAG